MSEKRPPSWIMVIAGVCPPDQAPGQIVASVLSATTVNLPLTALMRGSQVTLTDEPPIDCLKRLVGHVHPLKAPPLLSVS